MLIKLSQAVFGYAGKPIVQVDKLHLHAGSCMGIFGANGSGKTTLVRGLTGLLRPMQGTVERATGDAEPLRIGYLPQHRALELHWPMSGLDAAALAVSARRWFGWIGGERPRLMEAMATMGVAELAHRSFAKLSGGQQQRILLAGALAARPQVLILDEPTDGLDVRSRDLLLEKLRRVTADGLSTVLISHDVEDLVSFCNNVAWLHRGERASENVDAPSTVELIAPDTLVERVVAARRVR